MNMLQYFKSVIDQDTCAVVICSLEHEILYMNPAAISRYAKSGGKELIGSSLLDCHNPKSQKRIKEVLAWFEKKESNNIIYTFHNDSENKDVYLVALRDEAGSLIGYYEKHEYRNPETKAFYDYT